MCADRVNYSQTDELYLWWMSNPRQPIYIGTLRNVQRTAQHPRGVSLTYASEWLARGFPLSEDLPLRPDEFFPLEQDRAASAVDDTRPDRWGERVIRFLDKPPRLSTLEYLYFAGDDRFGALGVSLSPDQYLPRMLGSLPAVSDVGTMYELARKVIAGEPIPAHLKRLISPGVTLGGARPKALIALDGRQWVVKFSEEGDPFDTPLVEHATMTLARRAGIRSADTFAVPLVAGHALSEIASFGLTLAQAQRHVRHVAGSIADWKSHFAEIGVSARDIESFGQHIDRPFLRDQRREWLMPKARPAAKRRAKQS